MFKIASDHLNPRERAILQAVAVGRVQMSLSAVPALFIDGLACCDQLTAYQLTVAGLIGPGQLGGVGTRVPAMLTSAGTAAISAEFAA